MYVLNLQIVHHRKTGITGAYLTGIALGMEQRCARKNLDSEHNVPFRKLCKKLFMIDALGMVKMNCTVGLKR
jgi:hypothetical protein